MGVSGTSLPPWYKGRGSASHWHRAVAIGSKTTRQKNHQIVQGARSAKSVRAKVMQAVKPRDIAFSHAVSCWDPGKHDQEANVPDDVINVDPVPGLAQDLPPRCRPPLTGHP